MNKCQPTLPEKFLVLEGLRQTDGVHVVAAFPVLSLLLLLFFLLVPTHLIPEPLVVVVDVVGGLEALQGARRAEISVYSTW